MFDWKLGLRVFFQVVHNHFMVIFGFELVEHVFDNTFLIDQEADAVKTIVDFTHSKLPLEIFLDSIFDDF